MIPQEELSHYRQALIAKNYKEALQLTKSMWTDSASRKKSQEELIKNFDLFVSQLRLALHFKEAALFEDIYCELLNLEELETVDVNLLHFLRLEHLLLSGLLEKSVEQQTHLQADLLKAKDQERLLHLKSYIQSRSQPESQSQVDSENDKESETEANQRLNRLLKDGNFKAAMPLLEELTQNDPTNVNYLYNLAVTKLELSHYKDAIGLFNSCLVLDPMHQKSAFNIAQIAKGLGDEAGHLQYLRLCFQINPFSKESESISPEIGIGVN